MIQNTQQQGYFFLSEICGFSLLDRCGVFLSDFVRRISDGGQMVMRNTQPETMEEGGCCCQAGDFQEESFEIGKPGAVDPVLGLEVEEEGCPELLINFLPITSSLLLITGRE